MHHIKNSIILIGFLFLFFTGPVYSQTSPNAFIKGRIIDSVSLLPLAFASIQIYRSSNISLADGNLSSGTGFFNLSVGYGSYFVKVEFMGYKTFTSAAFLLSRETPVVELGNILLVSVTNTLEEVIVQAEKSSMQLTLDKKIFNVGKDLANAGGSASDILTNIPSVSVDPEGNVKLRGSDNVRILIDGKPSGLVSIKGGSGLQQLQASMVDRVEIITNPSARYEAEGMAGIINIILKKEVGAGF